MPDMESPPSGNPLDRIGALEIRVAALSQVVFGDDLTRTEGLFVRLDRLQFTIDRINARFMWLWGVLFFMLGLIVLVIVQFVWHAMAT